MPLRNGDRTVPAKPSVNECLLISFHTVPTILGPYAAGMIEIFIFWYNYWLVKIYTAPLEPIVYF